MRWMVGEFECGVEGMVLMFKAQCPSHNIPDASSPTMLVIWTTGDT